MKLAVLLIINAALLGLFVHILRKPSLLTNYSNGRFWLTWLGVGVITLMDELTSVFYAPAEAYRFIGPAAIFFIALTSIVIRYFSSRLVEISEILESQKMFGGGVYSFSYLVLGPMVSFVAVSSIMVDYILTACISAISAIENATSFVEMPHLWKIATAMVIVWGIAGLNIIGIRDNVRFTFGIFVLAAFVFLNLIASGVLGLDHDSLARLQASISGAAKHLDSGSWTQGYGVFIASVASCVLAYSGVESVLQTAGFVRSWREIAKAYKFLALTVGIVTPVVAALALSAPINFAEHEGDLITHYATMLNGAPFGIAVAVLASITLIMAVNTAFVASSELMERVAERYGFSWLIATNRRQSLYRIHIINAISFSCIILVTGGSQMILADMYALGLLACFTINTGSLVIYRYFMGAKGVIHYYTNRLGTIALFFIFLSCFLFLAWMKPHGTELWAIVTGIVLTGGLVVARTRAPEIKAVAQTDSHMDMVLFLAESTENEIHIIFRRPREEAMEEPKSSEVYVTFYNPRQGAPTKLSPNHFRFATSKRTLYQQMVALLKVVEYELADRKIVIHYGWPLSSWLDRMSIGVMVYNIMHLPKVFPRFDFHIDYSNPEPDEKPRETD
ncbi:MAG: APC family permease [Deltaproteobacteria bacterium]|nr:APC family permease [Deltaproteobacteria bacterium]